MHSNCRALCWGVPAVCKCLEVCLVYTIYKMATLGTQRFSCISPQRVSYHVYTCLLVQWSLVWGILPWLPFSIGKIAMWRGLVHTQLSLPYRITRKQLYVLTAVALHNMSHIYQYLQHYTHIPLPEAISTWSSSFSLLRSWLTCV